MNLKSRFPDFINFLSCWLADPIDDTLPDNELTLSYIRYGIPLPAYDRLLIQCKHLLKEKPFPWQEMATYANRVFKDETRAYQWLKEIVDVFEKNYPEK